MLHRPTIIQSSPHRRRCRRHPLCFAAGSCWRQSVICIQAEAFSNGNRSVVVLQAVSRLPPTTPSTGDACIQQLRPARQPQRRAQAQPQITLSMIISCASRSPEGMTSSRRPCQRAKRRQQRADPPAPNGYQRNAGTLRRPATLPPLHPAVADPASAPSISTPPRRQIPLPEVAAQYIEHPPPEHDQPSAAKPSSQAATGNKQCSAANDIASTIVLRTTVTLFVPKSKYRQRRSSCQPSPWAAQNEPCSGVLHGKSPGKAVFDDVGLYRSVSAICVLYTERRTGAAVIFELCIRAAVTSLRH